ncbi:MAG: PAS domain S-box protein [Maribacter sp.]
MSASKIIDNTRLEILKSYDLLDSSREKLYDDITKFAARVCKTPVSLLSIAGEKAQIQKSSYGIDGQEIPTAEVLCNYIFDKDLEFLEIENLEYDERFSSLSTSKSTSDICFYAAVNLKNSDGYALGSLCVIDFKPKKLSELQINTIRTLGNQIIQHFEIKKTKKGHEKNRENITNTSLLLRNRIKATRIGTWEWNLQTNSLTLNDKALEILGYTENEENLVLDRAFWERHIYPIDLSTVNKNLNEHINQNSDVYDLKYRIVDKSGKLLWIQERGKVINWDADEKAFLMVGSISDITKKVRYDTKLERLQNNQETLINATTDLIWSVDTQLKLMIANSAFIKIMKKQIGYELKEGDSIFSKKMNLAEKKKWTSYYQRALEGERFSIKEEINPTEEQDKTFGLISFNPIYNSKNKLLGVACYSKDITSEVISQQATLKEKVKLEKILDASLDIICTLDEEFRFLSINKAGKKTLGYSSKELLGKKFIEFVLEEDREASIELSKSTILGRKVKNFENRYLHKDGHLISMLWSGNWNNEDKVMYCVGRDITEKKIKEFQLAQSERRFKTLVQEGSDLVAILDEKANYSYVSPNSTKALQITPEEFIGSNAFQYIHPDDKDYVLSQFRKLVKKPQIKIKPFRFKNKNNEWRWMETVATNQLHEPAINGIVANSRDVTERILRLQDIEKQNRKLKSIAWNQSHVVRAPVARLLGLVGLLQEEGCLKKTEKEKILKYILESAEEIDDVIKQTIEQTATEKNVINKK